MEGINLETLNSFVNVVNNYDQYEGNGINNCGSIEAISKEFKLTHEYTIMSKSEEPLEQLFHAMKNEDSMRLDIDLAGWFDHTLMLYRINGKLYSLSSYVFRHKAKIQEFDLEKFERVIRNILEIMKIDKQTKFDEIAEIWDDLWNLNHVPRYASGPLDYHILYLWLPQKH